MILKNEKMVDQSNKKSYLVNTISILFMLYIACTIIFRMKYIYITYAIDCILISLFSLLVFMKKLKLFKINRIVFSYFVLSVFALASSFWALNFTHAMLKGFQLLFISINMFIIYNLIKNYHIERFFIYGVLLGSFVNYLLVFRIIPTFIELYTGPRLVGTMGNSNPFAVTMVISIVVSIVYLSLEKEKPKEKSSSLLYYYQYINIIFSLYLIILSISRAGIVFGFTLVFLYIVISMKDFKSFIRLSIVITIIMIIVVNFINLDDFWEVYDRVLHRFGALEEGIENADSRVGSTAIRIYLAKLGLQAFMDNPIIGVGVNNFMIYSGGIYSHNNYIELLAGLGIVGFIIFYSMHIFVLYKASQVSSTDLKIVFAFFVLVMFGMDMAGGSYYGKLILYTLLMAYLILERSNNVEEKRYE